MTVVKDCVEVLVDKELQAALEEYGLFASKHEAYAVILEEADEAKEELETLEMCLKNLWEAIKENDTVQIPLCVHDVKRVAIDLVCEAIQIAAMCRKYEETFGGENHAG